MSSDQNEEDEAADSIQAEENEDPKRVIETKHVFPEDYDCKSCVKNEKKCTKVPKLDETISRPITTNKLNETLRNQKCSHCGQAVGQCKCLADEARRELTKLHEYKQEETKEEQDEVKNSIKEV